MPVDILFPSGAGLTTSYSDTLQNAVTVNGNTSRLNPLNWIFGVGANPRTGAFGSSAWPLYKIGASSIDAANCLQWLAVGDTAFSNNLPAYLIPIALYNKNVYGNTQFSQCTLLQKTGPASGNNWGGLAVGLTPAAIGSTLNTSLFNPGLFSYTLQIQANGQGSLNRFGIESESDAVGLVNYGAGTFNNADILRLSMNVGSSSVVLTVTQNAVVLTTYTDNSANRITTGVPGLIFYYPSPNDAFKSEWRTFSAGVGL